MKSAIGQVLPESVKGFAIGMSNPDSVTENLETLIMANSDKDNVVARYINKDRFDH